MCGCVEVNAIVLRMQMMKKMMKKIGMLAAAYRTPNDEDEIKITLYFVYTLWADRVCHAGAQCVQ